MSTVRGRRLRKALRRSTEALPAQLDAAALLPVADAAVPARLKRREAVFRRLLAVGDVLAIMGVLGLLDATRGLTPRPGAVLILPGIVILGKILGLYDRDDVVLAKRSLDDAPALFQVATLVTLLAWLLAGLIFTADLTPTAGLQLWCTCFLALACARTLARALAKAMTDEDRVLLVGSGAAALQIRDKLVDSPGVKATFLGWIPFRGESDQIPALPAAGSIEDLSERVRALAIDRVIVAPTEQTDDEVLDLIRMVKALGVRVSILPRLFEVVGSSVTFDNLGGLTLLGVRPLGLSRSSRVVKRSLDVTGATVGLLATSPLLALAAVAMVLDSRGPVFFGQRRIGRDGRSFCIWKFRTMVRDAEDRRAELLARNEGAAGFFKIADDPRVTRVGRWLRRTQLDELPQLVNVLKGEMSLVGPRPLLEEEDARVEGWCRRRLQLTPGMTGHWQVLGSSRIPLAEMVVLDYLYVANWSLWNDVKILLRTIPRVFGARGL